MKEVVKALKKETKGVCVIAGDISPIDVITHVPILCEEANVPYVYVHSKEELGAAGMTKRPTSVMLVMPEGAKGSVKMSSSDKKEFDDMYEKIVAKVKSMALRLTIVDVVEAALEIARSGSHRHPLELL